MAGGLAAVGLAYAAAVAAEAIQVFVANPRGWAPGPGDPAQERALAEHVALTGLPVYVHAPYLINVGSPDPVLRDRSARSLRHSLRRATAIGARGVVVHAGSAIDGDRDAGLARAGELLLPLLDELGGDGPDLLVEPMAGQGQMLCSAIGELGPYLESLRWHPRARVCLDVCHLFAAGHDLAAGDGPGRLLSELTATAPGRLALVHANDSRDGCGSRHDRHESIGRGQVGLAAFAGLLGHPATEKVPFIVETPGGQHGHAADVAMLRALRDAGQPGGPGDPADPGLHAGGPAAGTAVGPAASTAY